MYNRRISDDAEVVYYSALGTDSGKVKICVKKDGKTFTKLYKQSELDRLFYFKEPVYKKDQYGR